MFRSSKASPGENTMVNTKKIEVFFSSMKITIMINNRDNHSFFFIAN